MKIAACDDSREDRDALRALLEACGHDFEIREYGSGAELYADMGYVRECGIVFHAPLHEAELHHPLLPQDVVHALRQRLFQVIL